MGALSANKAWVLMKKAQWKKTYKYMSSPRQIIVRMNDKYINNEIEIFFRIK